MQRKVQDKDKNKIKFDFYVKRESMKTIFFLLVAVMLFPVILDRIII